VNDRVPDASEWLLAPQLPGCHCSRNCCRASLNDLLACPKVVGTGRRNASVTEHSQRAGKRADRVMSALVVLVRRSCIGAQRSGGTACRLWRVGRALGGRSPGPVPPASVGVVPNYVAQTLWPAGGITDGACGSDWRAIQYDRVGPGPEPDRPPVRADCGSRHAGEASGTRAPRHPCAEHDAPATTGTQNQAATPPTTTSTPTATMLSQRLTPTIVAACASSVNAAARRA
jgi:hypothetical protein